ncbi:MAG: YceI family protein [Verrucomicrobia bacterium]|nr:YceI family protein [Verrucomicrobiota bacterium]
MKRCAGWMAAFVVFTAGAGAQEMPTILLSTNNCIVAFAVSSTWHPIKGEVKELNGWARFSRANDLNSLHGSVEVDVKALTTGSDGRDSKWRNECLEGGRFPKITFTVERVTVTANQAFLLSGLLTIRDTTRTLVFGGQFKEEVGFYHLAGTAEMKWTDYGVRDSSTFLTKIQPETKVLLELWLPAK